MTYDDGTIEAAEAQLRDEHRAVNAFLRLVVESEDPDGLSAMLRDLHTRLHQHFANEEYPGGIYERMGVLGPRFRDDVRQLVDDHYRMLAEVRDMADRLAGDGSVAGAVLAQVGELVEVLREHEEREHRLASEARRSQ